MRKITLHRIKTMKETVKITLLIQAFLETEELFGTNSRYMRLEGYEMFIVGTGVMIRRVSDK